MPVIIPCLEKNPFIILYSKGIPFIVPYIERIPFLIPHLERILFIIPYLEKNPFIFPYLDKDGKKRRNKKQKNTNLDSNPENPKECNNAFRDLCTKRKT